MPTAYKFGEVRPQLYLEGVEGESERSECVPNTGSDTKYFW